MKLWKLTAGELIEKIKSREVSVESIILSVLERIDEIETKLNSFITILKEEAIKRARQIDKKIKEGKKVGRLYGIPIAVKDNICTRGVRTTCASRILKNYTPPYNATVVEKILKEDAIIIGKTNMDEFAMGSSTETGCFGPTRNPWNLNYAPGGSSGGSASAITAGEAILALGSDTGGSIRCPASFCSIVGLKPTYGLVSRYGLIAYANSLEQIGPMAKNVYDCALLLSIIAGYDPLDSTSLNIPQKNYLKSLPRDISKMRIGIPKEFFGEGVEDRVAKIVWNAIEKFESIGADIEEISLSLLKYALATYYIIAMSEASSNLARYDGVRYGFHIKGDYTWDESFAETRGKGFGSEVKRRIMLGTFALSAGYFEQYYLKALKVRTLLKQDFRNALKKFDVLIGPTMPILPFKIGEKIKDPLAMYMCDILTVPINLVGVPAISVPCGFSEGLPVGMQIIGNYLEEETILSVAYTFEKFQKRGA